jgi:hypothetical protein
MSIKPTRAAVDLNSNSPIDYYRYVAAKDWSRSKGQRKKAFLPIIEIPGFKTQIRPREAELVLAGERPARLPIRRRPGRPRREIRRGGAQS